jgi:hypothetical protein
MMLELVADVGSECVELVVRQFRPDASRQTAGAEVAEVRARQMEVLQSLFQTSMSNAAWWATTMSAFARCVRNAGAIAENSGASFTSTHERPWQCLRSSPAGTSRALWGASPASRGIRSSSPSWKTATLAAHMLTRTVVGRFKVDAGDVHVRELMSLALRGKAEASGAGFPWAQYPAKTSASE